MSNPNPIPFKKTGADANPNGRPKREWTWSGLLEKVGEEIEEKSGKKFKDLVTKRLWVDAVNGSLGAQKEILNRMDGLPTQSIEQNITGKIQFNSDEVVGLVKATGKTEDSDANPSEPKV